MWPIPKSDEIYAANFKFQKMREYYKYNLIILTVTKIILSYCICSDIINSGNSQYLPKGF